MSPGHSHAIHCGEGQPATGVDDAMKEKPEVKLGSTIVTTAAGIGDVVEKSSMGLTGIWYTLTNVSCVVVICYMVLVQQPQQFQLQQDRTDRLVEKLQTSHERNTDRLAAAIDKLSERIRGSRGAIGLGDAKPECE